MFTKSKRMLKSVNWLTSFAFAVPALVCYILFVVTPIFSTFNISLHMWNGADPVMTFVGIENYLRVFSDPVFYMALKNNIFWILFTIFVPVLVGLILAVIVTQKFVRGKTLFRLTFFMPQVVSMVAVGIVWGWMYNPEYGMIGKILETIGLQGATGIDFLGNEQIVIWSLVIAGSWTCFGFNMVVFIAALQGIDTTYLEVALIEGANAVQRFFMVIVPLIKATVTLLVLNSLIGSFKVFDIIMIMTKGGPYHSSEVISTYMYNSAFGMNEYGYGSALAIILAVIIAICSAIYMHFAERE